MKEVALVPPILVCALFTCSSTTQLKVLAAVQGGRPLRCVFGVSAWKCSQSLRNTKLVLVALVYTHAVASQELTEIVQSISFDRVSEYEHAGLNGFIICKVCRVCQ